MPSEAIAISLVIRSGTFLPELESKSLDGIAKHYGLIFEERHRSIGDVKVTASFLQKLFAAKAQELVCWKDLAPFQVE